MTNQDHLLMETVTVTRPACRETLERRLASCLRERELRQKHGHGYPASASDGWLEDSIATLRAAIAAMAASTTQTQEPSND